MLKFNKKIKAGCSSQPAFIDFGSGGRIAPYGRVPTNGYFTKIKSEHRCTVLAFLYRNLV